MGSFIEQLIKLSNKLSSPDIPLDKKYKILEAITELDLLISDIKASGLGKAVKKCSKNIGKLGTLASQIVDDWTEMVLVSTENEVNSDKYDKQTENYEKKQKLKDIPEKTNKIANKNVNKMESDVEDNSDLINQVSQKRHQSPNDFDEDYNSEVSDNSKMDNIRSSTKAHYENNIIKKERYNAETYEKTKEISEVKHKKRIYEDNSKSQENFPNSHTTKYSHNVDQSSKPKQYSETIIPKSSHKIEEVRRPKPDAIKAKSRKTDSNNFTFENFLKDSAMAKPLKQVDKKRHSDVVNNDREVKKIKMKSPDEFSNFISNKVLPELSPSVSEDDIDEQSIYNRSDFQYKNQLVNKNSSKNLEPQEDVDCTSKYSSERKIWVPTRKTRQEDFEEDDEDVLMINGVPETVIAQYDYKRLIEFEDGDRKIMRKTECFWEKLFFKIHKCHRKRDGEKWREAFLRVQNETDQKLKELSARVKRNNDEKTSAINRAKFLNCVPGKNGRRVMPMHR